MAKDNKKDDWLLTIQEYQPLTAKQKKACHELVFNPDCKSRLAAYATAYNQRKEGQKGMSNATMRVKASVLFKMPKTQAYINLLTAPARLGDRINEYDLNMMLWEIGKNAERDSDKINALKIIATLRGWVNIQKTGTTTNNVQNNYVNSSFLNPTQLKGSQTEDKSIEDRMEGGLLEIPEAEVIEE